MRWLVAVLLLLPQPAFAAWFKATSTSFIVYSEGKAEDAADLAQRLERFDTLLRFVTGAKGEASPNRLIVFAVRNTDAVQELYSARGSNVAGFYSPDIASTVAVVPRDNGEGGQFDLKSQSILFHEYAHHFMLHYFPSAYPAWYVEGFAEYLSTVEFRKDGTVAVGLPAQHRFQSIARFPDYDVRRLLTGTGPTGGDDTEAFYAYSWLLTHYLRFAPDRAGQLDTYLRSFAAGVPPAEAAAAFGDQRKLGIDLTRYIKSNRLSYSFFKGLAQQKPAVAVTELDSATSEMMPLFMRFQLGFDTPEQTARFLPRAQKALAKFPDQPLALEMVAEAELVAGNRDAATKANDALIMAKPQDARALLRRARIAIHALGEDRSPQKWRDVRKLLLAANRAEPEDPFTLSLYYRSFLAARQAPSEASVEGLRRALFLSPQVRALRMTLASYLLTTGERAEGKAVLTPLLNDPHSASVREQARRMLDGGDGIKPVDATETATKGKDAK